MQSAISSPSGIDPFGDPVALSPGSNSGWRDGLNPFAIEADAKPLAALVEDAFAGARVCEFMMIFRPVDIYGYVIVRADGMVND